jgi:uncharacterized protein YlzI (FlbEa/FlbD family)
MLNFTDAVSGATIFVNPKYIVGIYTLVDGEHAGKVAITLVNGNFIAKEPETEVIGTIKSALVNDGCCK